MKSNIFILIIFTISSLILFGCDQIIDRSMEKLGKTKNNESTLTNKESSVKSLSDPNNENGNKKPKGGWEIKEGLSKDHGKELKKKYDVIGTNKEGPYRSGETSRIRSTK